MLENRAMKIPEFPQYTESEAIETLKSELEKGIESMKSGHLYTIDEAWAEIDAI